MNATVANPWFLLRSGADTAAANMALDHALLESTASLGRPVLRFYGWTEPAASFGYFQKHGEIERATLLRPLVRRPTGGGLVPHDADWTYSLTIPPGAPWYALKAIESYRRVHEWVRAAFAQIGAPMELATEARCALPGQCFAGHEQFDVLWQGRKIAGAAQRRTRAGLLIQGSVQPPPITVSRADWENSFCEVGRVEQGISWSELILGDELKARAESLVAKTYSTSEHNRRR